jgi:hypothetical protein
MPLLDQSNLGSVCPYKGWFIGWQCILSVPDRKMKIVLAMDKHEKPLIESVEATDYFGGKLENVN